MRVGGDDGRGPRGALHEDRRKWERGRGLGRIHWLLTTGKIGEKETVTPAVHFFLDPAIQIYSPSASVAMKQDFANAGSDALHGGGINVVRMDVENCPVCQV